MVYSLKIVLDTWLKLTTDQGSKLSSDQKQFVNAGSLLPLAGYEAVGPDHLKVTLGLDQTGKQVFYQGRNTWFVYRPAVQVLRDGQIIAPPIASPSPSPAPVYALKTVLDTWLKQSTAQGSQLASDQKQFIDAGTILPITSFEAIGTDHLKVTLGINSQGQQLTYKGHNTWFAYRPTVLLLRNGQRMALPGDGNTATPTPTPTPSRRTINAKGLQMIKTFEGLRLDAYIDAVGVWTIGYGTTAGVKSGMKITTAQAEEFLKRDVAEFEQAVISAVKVSINDDQFSALVCFTYNVGVGALASSTLLRLLNQSDYKGAADQLLRWNRGDRGELPGLTRRRNAERALFLGQDFTAFLNA